MEVGEERLYSSEEQGVCFEIVCPRNVRSYIHDSSPTWLPKHKLHNDNSDRHDNVGRRKPKNYRQLGREEHASWAMTETYTQVTYTDSQAFEREQGEVYGISDWRKREMMALRYNLKKIK